MDLANPAAFRPTLLAARHMVAAGHPLAAMAGMRVLEAGGNAVDAGVATGFALNVVQPDMANLGGVAPIVIREPNGRVTTIAGVGTWPRAATREGDEFSCDDLPVRLGALVHRPETGAGLGIDGLGPVGHGSASHRQITPKRERSKTF